jgi:hypothetical protein
MLNFSSIAIAEPSHAEWKATKTQAGGMCSVLRWAIVAAGLEELIDTKEKSYNMVAGVIQSCLDYRDALPSLQQLHNVELALLKHDLPAGSLPVGSITSSATADDTPSEGMKAELKFEDGWYDGIVTGVDEVAGGTFSLTMYFDCDKSTETNVPYPHPECRRLLAGTRKRKREAAILATCKGECMMKLVLPFLYSR